MEKQKALLRSRELSIGYQQGKRQVREVAAALELEMYAGQLICLLGPNGCGKSTLLRTVAGLQDPLSGIVEVEGENLRLLKPAHVAKKISMVLTDNVRSGDLDVYTLIALGRYPHSGWMGILDEKDKTVIDYAVHATGTAAFLERKVATLSDGECQKVMLARAIAQDTPIIILDEPTAHLDLPSRIQLMRLLHQLAKETNKTILISTHELDLALQVADQIWLMNGKGHMAIGMPEQLVLNGAFQQAFDQDGIAFDRETGTFNIHQQGNKDIILLAEGATAFWTKRALIRKGFNVHSSTAADAVGRGTGDSAGGLPVVEIQQEAGETLWILHRQSDPLTFYNLEELLQAI